MKLSKTKREIGFLFTLSMAILTFFIFYACNKTDRVTDVAKFVGTWKGQVSCTNGGRFGLDTITIGGAGNRLSIGSSIGDTVCLRFVSLTGNASGNTCTFPSATYTDYCGVHYTFSSTGSISGDTLTTISIESISGNAETCTFVGMK